jgi:hypothetical protein
VFFFPLIFHHALRALFSHQESLSYVSKDIINIPVFGTGTKGSFDHGNQARRRRPMAQ